MSFSCYLYHWVLKFLDLKFWELLTNALLYLEFVPQILKDSDICFNLAERFYIRWQFFRTFCSKRCVRKALTFGVIYNLSNVLLVLLLWNSWIFGDLPIISTCQQQQKCNTWIVQILPVTSYHCELF